MSVKEIQYINRDYCSNHSKPVIYLFYQPLIDKYPNTTYQFVVKQESPEKLTEAQIINKFKDNIKSTINVSQLCKKLVFVKSFQNEYSGFIDDIPTYPNFTFDVSNISNSNDPIPDKTLVWDINTISPKMCGMFFENLIAYSVNIFDDCYNLNQVLQSSSSNLTIESLINLLKRNFISEQYINNIKIEYKIIYVNDEKLNKLHFKDKYHYIIFLSLIHFMKYDLLGQDYEDAISILSFISKNKSYMNKYFNDIKNSTFVKNLSNETNLTHSMHIKESSLHGEMDFTSDISITDVKSYKINDPELWFSQLYLYQTLLQSNSSRKLRILNVYTNQVFDFHACCGS